MVCNYERSENRKGNPSGHGNRQGFLNEVPKAYETKQHMQTGECKTEKSFGTGKKPRSQETMTGWEKNNWNYMFNKGWAIRIFKELQNTGWNRIIKFKMRKSCKGKSLRKDT